MHPSFIDNDKISIGMLRSGCVKREEFVEAILQHALLECHVR